jgi:7-cyano-7-deazaguanine synthase
MTSGGMDSTVLAYWVQKEGYDVWPLFIDYGQHCSQLELNTLRAVLPAPLAERIRVVAVGDVFSNSRSRLIREPDLWRDSVVAADIILPYRNLFLLSAAVAFAANSDIATVYSAFINSNHAQEIDATREFLAGVMQLVEKTGSVTVEMPFRDFSKSEVAALGVELGAPIAHTFSCQVNSREHCGSCPNCIDRLDAFHSLVKR